MNLTGAQQDVLQHLRSSYLGPTAVSGDAGTREVTRNPPNLQYAVGMLFPSNAYGDQSQIGQLSADVAEGEIEEHDAGVPLAEDWRPSSAAISFVTDGISVRVDFGCGVYAKLDGDGPPRWKRTPFHASGLMLRRGEKPVSLLAPGGPELEIGSRWREFHGEFLVTVHVRVTTDSVGDDFGDIASTLFQVELSVAPAGDAHILEYDTTRSVDLDPEAAELRLRYRDRKVFAVGHGMAANWELADGRCRKVFLDPVPAHVVPSIETTAFEEDAAEARALDLDHLATIDSDPDAVVASLDLFVDAYSKWATDQMSRAGDFGKDADIAYRIAERSVVAAHRMREGIDVLRHPANEKLRSAFALGMTAMALQLRAKVRSADGPRKPQWRPFQLGFLLVAFASTVDDHHDDRETVDLIWFPTGGGKTEAYLGLAAIEIFRRRLVYGQRGGGTAILTRYTLRLLTSQQFQRAASLICAMELMRASDARVKGMPRFTIGLWVGKDVTPNTRQDAVAAWERLRKASRPAEANQLQIESCPWCDSSLLPEKHQASDADYGIRVEGRDVLFACLNRSCEFRDGLPLVVVDQVLYEEPPTILLATVDKFARLQFKPEAGRLLGIETPFVQPSLIIQDELHLLSGPLGTTVAVFDAVVQLLLSRSGSSPKIVASTATIRASDDQVRGMYGREVKLYPPSGLDGDTTFFSQPVKSKQGRLYIGAMPQSMSQASAVVAIATPMVEIPEVLDSGSGAYLNRDAYWTLVMYHNSLRELGRSSALIVDDVNGRLEPRADRLGIRRRTVQAGNVLELTSHRGADQLPNDLRTLKRGIGESADVIDVVLSSNMLSVGIDIPRLALMLMVGQPKTSAEYIQATSRVGRGDTNGVVVTLFRSNRPRDRSHFETFGAYHEALYRSVEPTSVTPWSLASRDRSLAGALVALVRQSFSSFSANDAAGAVDLDNEQIRSAVERLTERLLEYVRRSDPDEAEETEADLEGLLIDWHRRAQKARTEDDMMRYEGTPADPTALLRRFGQQREGWLVGDSMRSVEPNVAIVVTEPQEKDGYGTHQA
ncbi:helicase-related protein [Nocardia sp. NPDC055053]